MNKGFSKLFQGLRSFSRPHKVTLALLSFFLLPLNAYSYFAEELPSKNRFAIPSKILEKVQKDRAVLVLDLDETLIYSRRTEKPNHNRFVEVQLEGGLMWVEFRPDLQQFLAATSQIFYICIYTASTQAYADVMIQLFDHNHVIKRRFYRPLCVRYNGSYIKDLKKVSKLIQEPGQPIRRLVLVDDNADTIYFNSSQSIKIKCFEGNQKDKELERVFGVLLKMYE